MSAPAPVLVNGSVCDLTTRNRQYARIVDSWVRQLGLDKASYGTHRLRRTKATLIYQRTKNLRAVRLLLGHTKLESTVRYLVAGSPCRMSPFSGGVDNVRQARFEEKGSRRFHGSRDRQRARAQ